MPGAETGTMTRHTTAKRARAEIRRGFEQRGIEPFERGVHRQHEEGQKVVDEADEHRAIVVEQRQRGGDEMQADEHGVDEARVAQDEEPGVGADEKTGPEGQQDELQIEVLASAGARDEERERKAEQRAESRGEAAIQTERQRMAR